MTTEVMTVETPIMQQIQVGTKSSKQLRYVAEDGKDFKYASDCEKYEHKLAIDKILADVKHVRAYCDDFNDWYLFKDEDTLRRYILLISKENIGFLEDIFFPQWIGIRLNESQNSRDWYSFTTLDMAKSEFKLFEDTLNS